MLKILGGIHTVHHTMHDDCPCRVYVSPKILYKTFEVPFTAEELEMFKDKDMERVKDNFPRLASNN